MKNKEKAMDVVFLLDRSGSMSGMEKDTIGGYNSYLKSLKGNVRITTILFDDKYEMLSKRIKKEEIQKLNEKKYFVRGSTALLDAIGKSILYMEEEKVKRVLFVITTDGMENASREFTKSKIKDMISKHPNWEFMYIGADIDSYAEGESLGIKRKNIANYEKSDIGVSKLFASVSCASEKFYEGKMLDDSWKKELE